MDPKEYYRFRRLSPVGKELYFAYELVEKGEEPDPRFVEFKSIEDAQRCIRLTERYYPKETAEVKKLRRSF
jgi:hypothetical protein